MRQLSQITNCPAPPHPAHTSVSQSGHKKAPQPARPCMHYVNGRGGDACVAMAQLRWDRPRWKGGPPRATRCALRRHRSRARALVERGYFDHAALARLGRWVEALQVEVLAARPGALEERIEPGAPLAHRRKAAHIARARRVGRPTVLRRHLTKPPLMATRLRGWGLGLN